MDIIRNRRPPLTRPPVGRLQAQDLGEEQAVAGLYGYVEFAGLRRCYCSCCEGGSWS